MFLKFELKKVKFHKDLVKKAKCKCDNCDKIYLREARGVSSTNIFPKKTFCNIKCRREFFKDCKVDGCNKNAYSAHLCKSHYIKKQRYGVTEGPKCQVCDGRSVNPKSKRNKQTTQKMNRIFKGIMCSLCYKDILRRYILFVLENKCSCCGEKELNFLAIDHKFGGGSKERKIIGEKYSYYENIIKNIKKYQILCHNCNVGKWINKGKCPHKDAHV